LALACGTGCKGDAKLPGEDMVLATVNGSPITGYELERTLDKTLGRFAVPSVERDARKSTLESLLESRALAQASEAELTPEEKQVLDKEVAAYREALLVKSYLGRHSPPQTVSEEQRQAYYKEHASRFGARSEQLYELLGTQRALVGAERIAAMKSFSQAAQEKSLAGAAEGLGKAGIAVTLTSGAVSDPALDPKLREALMPHKAGEWTGVVFVQGRAFIGRVTSVREVPPRPYAEVRPEIDKALGPVALRDAVSKLGHKALQAAKVERLQSDLEASHGK